MSTMYYTLKEMYHIKWTEVYHTRLEQGVATKLPSYRWNCKAIPECGSECRQQFQVTDGTAKLSLNVEVNAAGLAASDSDDPTELLLADKNEIITMMTGDKSNNFGWYWFQPIGICFLYCQ